MLDFRLEPGLTINEAITRPLLQAGIAGAVVEIEGGEDVESDSSQL